MIAPWSMNQARPFWLTAFCFPWFLWQINSIHVASSLNSLLFSIALPCVIFFLFYYLPQPILGLFAFLLSVTPTWTSAYLCKACLCSLLYSPKLVERLVRGRKSVTICWMQKRTVGGLCLVESLRQIVWPRECVFVNIVCWIHWDACVCLWTHKTGKIWSNHGNILNHSPTLRQWFQVSVCYPFMYLIASSCVVADILFCTRPLFIWYCIISIFLCFYKRFCKDLYLKIMEEKYISCHFANNDRNNEKQRRKSICSETSH